MIIYCYFCWFLFHLGRLSHRVVNSKGILRRNRLCWWIHPAIQNHGKLRDRNTPLQESTFNQPRILVPHSRYLVWPGYR
ncbi:unnamed protein product [Allacma fusca]|uniref:Secreted protein n=1 Tax=Allacma fusca TaxID=39272 RepID=A0A8J2LAM0_9HEXA|nr:unnamed protein product [Allacma fusca]